MWSAEIASICLCHKTVPSKGGWLSWHQQGQILLRCHFPFSSVLADNAWVLTSKSHIQCAYSKCIFKCLQIIANVSLYFHAFTCLFHPRQIDPLGRYFCFYDDVGKVPLFIVWKLVIHSLLNLLSQSHNKSGHNLGSFYQNPNRWGF